jgi:hypothetical protein
MASLAPTFVVHGLGQFTVAMAQGFTIPMVPSAKLGLVCHTKTVGHALLLFGLAAASPHLSLGPNATAAGKWLIIVFPPGLNLDSLVNLVTRAISQETAGRARRALLLQKLAWAEACHRFVRERGLGEALSELL